MVSHDYKCVCYCVQCPSVDGRANNTLVRSGRIHKDGSKREYLRIHPKENEKMKNVDRWF